jgi:hypothetical protein
VRSQDLWRLLASLAAGLLPFVPGFGIEALICRRQTRNPLSRGAWAWLLGVAYTGIAGLAVSSVLHLPLKRRVAVPLLLLPVAIAVLRRRRVAGWRSVSLPRAWSVRLALFCGALASTLVAADALVTPVADWDGRMTWAVQVKFMRAETTALPSALTDATYYVSHPQYPPLLAVVQVLGLEAVDAPDDERAGRLLYALCLPAFLLIVYDSARRAGDRTGASAAVLVAVFCPFVVFNNHGGASGCYSDFPLACFFGAGVAALLDRPASCLGGTAAGLVLGAAVLTKNEGLPLALGAIALGAMVAAARMRRRRRFANPVASWLGATTLVLAAAWLLRYWRSQIPNRFDEDYFAYVFASHMDVASMARRVALAAPVLVKRSLSLADWHLTWPLLGTLLVLSWLGRRGSLGIYYAAAAAVPLCVGLGAYAIHWSPAELAGVTRSRFLLQGSMAAFVQVSLYHRSRPRWRASLRHGSCGERGTEAADITRKMPGALDS